MATYYLAVGIDPNTTTNPMSDGTHQDAQYGFAVDWGTGQGPQVLGSGSGATGRTFEAVPMGSPSAGANNVPLQIVLFSNVPNIDTTSSYIRLAFRPAHDTAPAVTNLDTSPLSVPDTNTLLNGVYLPPLPSPPLAMNGTSYGLPSSTYNNIRTMEYTLSGQHGTDANFELTVELTVVNGSTYHFKVDPEMMIDF